jgi:hypothetical protein
LDTNLIILVLQTVEQLISGENSVSVDIQQVKIAVREGKTHACERPISRASVIVRPKNLLLSLRAAAAR